MISRLFWAKLAVIKRVWRRRTADATAVKILHQNYFSETAAAFCWAPSEFKITMVVGCSLRTIGGMPFGSDIHSKRGNNLTFDCLCFEESKKQADFIETKDCKSLSAIFQHSTTKRRFHSSDISSNPDNTQMLIFSIFHPSTAISHGLSKSI